MNSTKMRIAGAGTVLGLALLGAQGASAASLYLTSIDPNGHFARYDTVADSWQRLNDIDTGAQMAVSGTGELYAWRRGGNIQRYDAGNDTWNDAQSAVVGANNSYGNLEITNDGRFFYTETNNRNLFFTDNAGNWNSIALNFNPNAVGDYDPVTGQLVVGEFGSDNAHLIDVNNFTVTDFLNGPAGNGERARLGTVIDGRYYFQYGGLGLHAYDLANNAQPAVAVSAPPANAFYNSGAAADRINGALYVGSLDGAGLQFYDVATNTFTNLANYVSIGNHSSLAFAQAVIDQPAPEPLTAALALLGLAGVFGLRRRT